MGQPQRAFDTLFYLNQLKGAGFSERQATAQTEALFAVLDDQLLTEKDMRDIESNLKQDMHDMEMRLNTNMHDVKEGLKQDMHDMEMRLNNDIKGVEAKLSQVEIRLGAEIKDVETRLSHDIKTTKHELIIALGSLMVVLFTVFSGLNFGLTKLIH